jgi:cupin superfamily acireductone dioxygenase involved in methionine salvage
MVEKHSSPIKKVSLSRQTLEVVLKVQAECEVIKTDMAAIKTDLLNFHHCSAELDVKLENHLKNHTQKTDVKIKLIIAVLGIVGTAIGYIIGWLL